MITVNILTKELLNKLEASVKRHQGEAILLSGGLDTSVLAFLMKNLKPVAITAIFEQNHGPDLYYSKRVTEFLGFDHKIKIFKLDEALEAVRNVIHVLRTFDPMEIRNSITIYIALSYAKQLGLKSIVTGDGGDELFAGYSYMYKMKPQELEKYIKELSERWFFSAVPLGESLGLKIEQPYIDREFVDFALSIPPEFKVHEERNSIYGKWIVRKAIEGLLPDEIVWRTKDPIEIGSGSTTLTQIISKMINKEEFEKLGKEIILRDYEQAYYYKLFKEIIGNIPKPKSNEKRCSFCGAGVPADSKYCRTCGAYPV
ncbi:MAG: asparagine synthase-related protein [Thermoprotei archaeon]|jgi:asparagine synthase (glutamine-hydrolysing)